MARRAISTIGQMPPEPPAPALRLRIDREAIADNWHALDALSAPDVATGAAIKANAYGLGVEAAIPALRQAGAREFFVAHWSEVADAAQHTDPASLVVLHGPLTGDDAVYGKALGVRPVINSVLQAKLWTDAGAGTCDLMVDTGMNRLGLPMDDLGNEAIAALDIEVLHSHLASADEDCAHNAAQHERWLEARGQVQHRRAALANSAGIALGRDYHGDLTRPGLALYGGVPRAELAGAIRQVAFPQAAVMQTRQLRAGETVGYNATFTAKHDMRLGTVSLGYADGYLRAWSEKGCLRTGESNAVPVLGRVSMDMTVVDLTGAEKVREGDWLDVDYDLPAAAATTGLSQYELLTVLGQRFQRL